MRDTMWNEKVQRMVINIEIEVLSERDKYSKGMKLEEMNEELTSHILYQNFLPRLARFLARLARISKTR